MQKGMDACRQHSRKIQFVDSNFQIKIVFFEKTEEERYSSALQSGSITAGASCGK